METGRSAKEAFVSGHSGTSFAEVYLVLSTCCFGVLLRHVGLLCLETIRTRHRQSYIFAFTWDFATVFLPAVLCFTVLAEHILFVLASLLLLSCAFSIPKLWKRISWMYCEKYLAMDYPTKMACIAEARVWTNIFTAIAILAVDFHIFPRRYSKAETYGTGVMDCGVGCFMICHGLVAKEARNPHQIWTFPTMKEYFCDIAITFKKLLPFVVVGMIRLASVNATDYQLHITEYGVHWNFFFTIAAVKMLVALFHPLLSWPSPWLTALLIGVIYQLLLSWAGLGDYLMFGPNGDYSRPTLFSANREGIVSCLGYLAIYYSGMQMGRFLFQVQPKKMREMAKAVTVLLVAWLVCVAFTVLLDAKVEPVSRRFANLSFVLWITTVAGLVIMTLFLVDIMSLFVSHLTPNLPPHALSPLYSSVRPTKDSQFVLTSQHLCIMSAIDYNQFSFFLLANLSTGLVNFTVDTMATGPSLSLYIVTGHMFVTCLTVTLLHQYRIKLF